LPVKLLKLFLDIEDIITDVSAEQKKKMTKIKSVSYNRIKQKFKKFLQTTGEGEMTYEKQLKKFRENPISEASEEEEEKEEEVPKPKKAAAKEESSEEEEESEEDSESDEEIKAERKIARD